MRSQFRTERVPAALNRSPARQMAQTAQTIRDAVKVSLAGGTASPTVERLYQAYLAHVDAGADQFADTLAQVAVYALFVARCLHAVTEPFSRTSLGHLPAPHPFLEVLFVALGAADLIDDPLAAPLDKLARVLAPMNFEACADEDERGTLVGVFYEAFLRAYDPALRGRRGVYLTPEPVVGYLVRSVDALLANDLGVTEGMANRDADVHLIVEDPACGTGAFLAGALAHVGGRCEPFGLCNSLALTLQGYELLPAPYLLAHLLLGIERRSVSALPSENLRISLVNALETLDAQMGDSDAEGNSGALVTGDGDQLEAGATPPRRGTRSGSGRDVFVMLGNPPYRGHSANDGRGIVELLHGRAPDGSETANYFALDGVPLAERNSKWLLDDYVKFIRYAQWRIEQAGSGILAFVTNSSYLEGPIFRGMRRSLMRSFDALYVLDLHGSSRQREQHLDASGGVDTRYDENVFAIQQGVALALFVRRQGAPGLSRKGRVWHADLRGTREEKLGWLATHSVADTSWQAIEPQPLLFTFIPRRGGRETEAESWSLTALMPEHSLGVLTKRDGLVVGFEPAEVTARIADFADPARSDAECATLFRLPLRDRDRWDLARARKQLVDTIRLDAIRPYTYRPLDTRSIYYDPCLVARPNRRVLHHLDEHPENVALVVGRQGAATGAAMWDVAFVTTGLVDQNLFRRGGGCVFPLYLYPYDSTHYAGCVPKRHANLAPEFVAALATMLKVTWIDDGRGDLIATVGPEDVLAYIYALLFAPSFRSRHAAALRAAFPRIPLRSGQATFRALCQLGGQLIALHLGHHRPATLPHLIGEGSNRVEHVRYIPGSAHRESGAVAINATQRFEGVRRGVWELTVGGYHMAQKWLLDRRGRELSAEDVERYREVIGILEETRGLMRQIDEALGARDARD